MRLFSFYVYCTVPNDRLILTGEVSSRICTAAEMRYYFSSFTNIGITDDGVPHQLTYLKPNLNCNLTNWEAGCEPGWGCSLDGEDKVDLKASHIPARTTDCQPCCEGFFCPEGITCMIRKYGLTDQLSLLIEMQSTMWSA